MSLMSGQSAAAGSVGAVLLVLCAACNSERPDETQQSEASRPSKVASAGSVDEQVAVVGEPCAEGACEVGQCVHFYGGSMSAYAGEWCVQGDPCSLLTCPLARCGVREAGVPQYFCSETNGLDDDKGNPDEEP